VLGLGNAAFHRVRPRAPHRCDSTSASPLTSTSVPVRIDLLRNSIGWFIRHRARILMEATGRPRARLPTRPPATASTTVAHRNGRGSKDRPQARSVGGNYSGSGEGALASVARSAIPARRGRLEVADLT
jgi:hypothetical protein